jgi:hypothetical protein
MVLLSRIAALAGTPMRLAEAADDIACSLAELGGGGVVEIPNGGVGDDPEAAIKTATGLKVKVSVLEKVYETGRKRAAGFKETMKIVFDKILPKWNYRAVPEPA